MSIEFCGTPILCSAEAVAMLDLAVYTQYFVTFVNIRIYIPQKSHKNFQKFVYNTVHHGFICKCHRTAPFIGKHFEETSDKKETR